LRPWWLNNWWLLSHVAVAALLVATVNMGFWQLRRLDARQAHNATVAVRADEPVVSLSEALVVLAAGGTPDDLQYVRVSVEGTWDPGSEVLLANRSQDGVPGVHAVSLLRVYGAAGPVGLVVDRGFVPRPLVLAGDRSAWSPSGLSVVLTGSLDRFRAGEMGHGEEVDRIDRMALEARWGLTLAPMWLQAAEPTGADTWPVPAPVADLGDGPHLSYAFQWFVFSVIGLVGYPLVLARLTRHPGRRSGGSIGSGPNRSVPEWDAPVA